jgi:hypothetical protein
MNKFLILSICALLIIIYPVYASNSTNGIDIQQLQNDQDIYGQINNWFTGLMQSSDPIGYISQNNGIQNFVSSIFHDNNVTAQIDNLLQDSNINSVINTTMQNGEIQRNINSLMQNI